MRRLTTALTADEFGRAALNLGRADENAAVRVEIDLSAIMTQEPSASAHLTVESPVGAKYPASTVMDGGKLIWDVSDADTAAEGTGRAQLTVTGPGGEVLKSAVAVTRVGHSLRGEGEAPEPLKSWVDDAVAKLAAVESAIADAQQVADDIRQQLESGAFVGPKGDKGDTGEKGDKGDDASVTTENIQAALGYVPVKDVQVAGTSVLVDGAANVPNVVMMSDEGRLRVFAPPTSTKWTGSIGVGTNGNLLLASASPITINSRGPQFVSGTYVDHAVKAAMCDGKGAAWTDAERLAALLRLGCTVDDNGVVRWTSQTGG